MVLSRVFYILVPSDVMQNFSHRPEVQLRAINKFLTMPEDQLGKSSHLPQRLPGKAGRWELSSFYYRLSWTVLLTGTLLDSMLISEGGWERDWPLCMIANRSTGNPSSIREAEAKKIKSQPA